MARSVSYPEFSADKLIAARERVGWSREDLASASGLSYFSILHFEKRAKSPSRLSLQALVNALGIDPADLFDNSGDCDV
jgi:transcriptional regulator with XRE-family HTH domain